MAVQVKRGVPIPPRNIGSGGRRGQCNLYPWDDLQPGDAFDVPLEGSGLSELRQLQRRMDPLASYHFGRGGYCTRIIRAENLVRVWRLK